MNVLQRQERVRILMAEFTALIKQETRDLSPTDKADFIAALIERAEKDLRDLYGKAFK